jgi:hypothetical protein
MRLPSQPSKDPGVKVGIRMPGKNDYCPCQNDELRTQLPICPDSDSGTDRGPDQPTSKISPSDHQAHDNMQQVLQCFPTSSRWLIENVVLPSDWLGG